MRSGLNKTEDWLGDLRAIELMPWRFGYRAQLARLDDPRVPWPHVRLIASACRATIGHPDAVAQTRQLIAEYRGDGLWPALARHLIRENTASDVTLLEGIARNPQQRSGALEWALRYYVRGDILLPDSSEVTLDELCARAGQASLPYLVQARHRRNGGRIVSRIASGADTTNFNVLARRGAPSVRQSSGNISSSRQQNPRMSTTNCSDAATVLVSSGRWLASRFPGAFFEAIEQFRGCDRK